MYKYICKLWFNFRKRYHTHALVYNKNTEKLQLNFLFQVWLCFNEKCHFVAVEDVEAERILLGVLEGPGLEVGLGALEG